jgi:hypothetical protein
MAQQHIRVGIFFLFLQVLVSIRNIWVKDYHSFFWICDFVPVLFAIAFLTKRGQFIKGLINVSLVAQLTFVFELLVFLLFGINLGATSALLRRGIFYMTVSILLHFFSASVALYYTLDIKPRRSALYYSAFFLAVAYILTLSFTPYDKNLNFVYSSSFLGLNIPYYTQLWLLLTFLLICLPVQGLQELLYRVHMRSRKNALATQV